ncbi:adenosylhomocysteinase [Methylomarinovum tepidoasis]|uniref:Adenosylhomocysteinase n=1 Tax=Methylomarinovum tepidoasis TaxID=2840183 RepID=A0AAU9CGE9_9GAMM|nr:adenosylhomocysteinase [Methylomarinovum sp. IN45]BCX88401.1 adenosylhomocysteinase [Methylomarinovum sp. IN45]
MTACDINDPALAPQGWNRIEWAGAEMPVLARIRKTFTETKPLAGVRIGACLHVTTETANLVLTLQAAGAEVALCASNPLSTQDDVAAALVEKGIAVFARRGEDEATYYGHIRSVLDTHPRITLDDGADLVTTLHRERPEQLAEIAGGTEETTTGVIRLRAMAKDGVLKYPIVAVNDALTKHLFDNRYGTGQSALDGVIRATNILLAGRNFVVCGYGWCGRGIAMRARGHGAHVIVTEVDPLRALEAAMDGYQVMPLREAAKIADFIVTATGDKHVVDAGHLAVMKDGCILANAGHFNVEINISALERLAESQHHPRPHVTEYRLADGRRLRLLAEGRLVNLAAAEGHPAAVMDMSFANQALVVEYLWRRQGQLPVAVHAVPAEIDQKVARHKLDALNIAIDALTPEQQAYLASWQEGT